MPLLPAVLIASLLGAHVASATAEEERQRRGLGGFLSGLGSAVVEGMANAATGTTSDAQPSKQAAASTSTDPQLAQLEQQLAGLQQLKATYGSMPGGETMLVQLTQQESRLRVAMQQRRAELGQADAPAFDEGASQALRISQLEVQLQQIEQLKAVYAGQPNASLYTSAIEHQETELRRELAQLKRTRLASTSDTPDTHDSALPDDGATVLSQLDAITRGQGAAGTTLPSGTAADTAPAATGGSEATTLLSQLDAITGGAGGAASGAAGATGAAGSGQTRERVASAAAPPADPAAYDNSALLAQLAAIQAGGSSAGTGASEAATSAALNAGDDDATREARTRAALTQNSSAPAPTEKRGLFGALASLGKRRNSADAGQTDAQAQLAALQAQQQAAAQQQLAAQQAAAAQQQRSGGLGGMLGGLAGGLTGGSGGGFLGGVAGALMGGDGVDTDSAAALASAQQAQANEASMGLAQSSSMGFAASGTDLAMLQSRDSMSLRGGSPVPPSDLPELPASDDPYTIPAGSNFVNNVDMKVEAVRAYARAAMAMLQSQIALSRAFGLSEQADALTVQAQAMSGGDLRREDVQSFVAVSSETNTLINARIAEGAAIEEDERQYFGAGLAYYGVGLVRTREFAQELAPYFSDLQDTLTGVMNSAPGATSTSNTLSLLSKGAALLNPENRRTMTTLVYVAMSAPNLLSSHGQTFRNLTSYASSNQIDVPNQQEALDTLGELEFDVEMEVAAEG